MKQRLMVQNEFFLPSKILFKRKFKVASHQYLFNVIILLNTNFKLKMDLKNVYLQKPGRNSQKPVATHINTDSFVYTTHK